MWEDEKGREKGNCLQHEHSRGEGRLLGYSRSPQMEIENTHTYVFVDMKISNVLRD